MIYMQQTHISSMFRAKIAEKKQENVNTKKIKSQILGVGFGRTKNSCLSNIKQSFSDEFGQ